MADTPEAMESSNSAPDDGVEHGGGDWLTQRNRSRRSRSSPHVRGSSATNINNRPDIDSHIDIDSIINSDDLVIIVEPTADNTKEQCDQFMFNSSVRKHGILNSIIGNYVDNIKSVKVSRDGKKVIIALVNGVDSPIPVGDVKLMYEIHAFGECHVECRKPKSGSSDKMIGVIQNYHQLSNLDSIKEELARRAIGYTKIERLMRNRGGRKEPTTAVLVEFKDLTELPKSITVDFCRHTIREFEREPIRCYKCQGFGHLARTCKSYVSVCGKCSLPHSTKECPNDKEPGLSGIKIVCCANCKGDHPAFFKQCPVFIENREIIKVQDVNKVSYAAATRIVKLRRSEANNNSETRNLPVTSRAPGQSAGAGLSVGLNSSQFDFFDGTPPQLSQASLSNSQQRTCISQIPTTQSGPQLNPDQVVEILQSDKVMSQIHDSIIKLFPAKLIIDYLHLFVSACMPVSVKLNKDAKQRAHTAFERIFGNLKEKDTGKPEKKRPRDSEKSSDNLTRENKSDLPKKTRT